MSTPPPKTPGFAKALFGLFSTAKKPRAVDSSTEATASVARSPHSRMQISLQSPSERDSSMGRNDRHTNYFGAAAPSTVDLLDNRALSSPPAAAAAVATAAVSFATKSPWKQPSSTTTKLTTMNGKSLSHLPVQFSHGNLKPAPSNGGTQRSIGRTNRRRSRYRPSKVLIGAKRRHLVVNQANALSALEESRGIFQPSDRQLQARDNYTSMRPGKRLLGDTQRGGSRLVPAATNGAGSSSTTTSETHVMSSSEEQPTKRRKKVMFGQGVAASAPIESETVTPSRSITRRKETPFKPNQQQEDTDMMERDSQMTMQSLSTARQSPARKLLEKTEVRLVLGRDDLSFIQPGEHEFLGPAVANLLPTLRDLDPLQTASSVSEIAREPAYFSPTTLAIGGGRNKTTNKSTVVDHTADDPDKMTFTCKKCGTSNSNNLSTCNKCNEPRASQSKGWGNLWDAQKNKWKCETCSVPNEQDAYKCVSCDTLRPGHEDKAEKANAAIGSTSAAIGAVGFHFGGGASASSSSTGNFFAQAPVDALASTTTTGGFSFSGGSSSSAPNSGGFTFVGAQAASSDKETSASTGSTDGTKTPTFSFGSTLAAPSASAINSTTSENSKGPAAKPIGFSFASSPAPSTGGEPFKFTVGDPETKNSDDAPKPKPTPTFQFGSAPANTVTTAPSTEPASKRTRPTNGGMGSSSSSSSTSKTDAPSSSQAVFSFGNRSGGSASGSVAGASGFGFAGTPATAPAPPVKGSLFEQPAGQKPPLPPSLGRLLGNDNDNDDRANRRRGRDDGDSNPLAHVPAATFGSAPVAAPPATTFGSNPPNQATPDPATADLSFAGSTSSVFKFGQSPSNANAAKPPVPTFGANSSAAPAALSFGGSTPVAPGPTTMSAPAPIFGGPSAAPPALAPTFGAPALALPSSSAPLFGGTVDPQQAPTFQFGSAPVPGAASTFGSTPAPSAPTFGSAPAPVAPAFGSAPAPAFGSTPAPAAPTFGSTPAPTQGHFGSTPAPAAAFGSAAPAAQPFGSAPVPAPFGGGGFGGPPPAAAPASFGGGFGGAPAPGGFGGGGFGGPPPAAPPQQPGAFGGAPAANFGGGFMAPPAAAPPVTGAPQFSIGSSGGNAGKTPGRRRILKARRPGSRQA